MTSEVEVAELRAKVALACRILAQQGLVRDITGHVSARIPGSREMLIRCRGEDEFGVEFTNENQVRQIDFDGHGAGLGTHVAPLELPIHGEIYKARADAGAVVHAHPTAVLLCGLAGVELRPLFGAYDPYALAIAVAGVPVFPRSVLIDTPALGAELVAAFAGGDVCLMRGHGIAVMGATVEQATIRAIKVEALARIAWEVASSGLPVHDLPAVEAASFDRGGTGGVIPGGGRWLWRHYARLAGEPATSLGQ